MASFDTAFAALMGEEGSKLLNDPATGEYSRYGITLKTAAAFGYCQEGNRAYIDNLTELQAREFYLTHFWTPCFLGRIFFDAVSTKVFDMVVNMGRTEAATIIQRTCGALGRPVKVDGMLGFDTLAVLNLLDAHEVVPELRAESLQFYRDLVTKDPAKYEKYWDTWKARAEK